LLPLLAMQVTDQVVWDGLDLAIFGAMLVGLFGSAGPIWPLDILIPTGFFTTLWLMSAWLFRKTATSPPIV